MAQGACNTLRWSTYHCRQCRYHALQLWRTRPWLSQPDCFESCQCGELQSFCTDTRHLPHPPMLIRALALIYFYSQSAKTGIFRLWSKHMLNRWVTQACENCKRWALDGDYLMASFLLCHYWYASEISSIGLFIVWEQCDTIPKLCTWQEIRTILSSTGMISLWPAPWAAYGTRSKLPMASYEYTAPLPKYQRVAWKSDAQPRARSLHGPYASTSLRCRFQQEYWKRSRAWTVYNTKYLTAFALLHVWVYLVEV